MTYLSVDEQNVQIRRRFPEFRMTANADLIGVWEGPVRPAAKTYTIRIVYFRRKAFDGWFLSNPYVTVHVIDPLIGTAMTVGAYLPHVYWNDRLPAWPSLCLWDPKEIFWTPEMSIASTIIPWASEWLLFFEYWQITGDFLGPGRHPSRSPKQCPESIKDSPPEIHAQKAQFRDAEFHRIGRKTGVFGSYLSMGAALRDCSLQLFSPNLNSDIWAAAPWRAILISSQGRQPAESLHLDLERV